MEIETLKEKVSKAAEKVEKRKKILERHRKLLMKDGYKDSYYIERKNREIEEATKKLEDAMEVLQNWKHKLNMEIQRERFVELNAPQVIKDFLEKWKIECFNYFVKLCERLPFYIEELKKEEREAQIEYIKKTPKYADYLDEKGELNCELKEIIMRMHWDRDFEEFLRERGCSYSQLRHRIFQFAGPTVSTMYSIKDETKRLQWLEEELEKDKNYKLSDLIHRICKFTGTITDASSLRVSPKGNLDGFVIGEKGKARVQTIGAGGHNVQIFHFRTLVHKY